MTRLTTLIPLMALGFALRLLLENYSDKLTHYVYFNTPLIDLRQLFECFNNFKMSGRYFLDLNSINQSILVVKVYHILYDLFGNVGIRAALFTLDLITVFL